MNCRVYESREERPTQNCPGNFFDKILSFRATSEHSTNHQNQQHLIRKGLWPQCNKGTTAKLQSYSKMPHKEHVIPYKSKDNAFNGVKLMNTRKIPDLSGQLINNQQKRHSVSYIALHKNLTARRRASCPGEIGGLTEKLSELKLANTVEVQLKSVCPLIEDQMMIDENGTSKDNRKTKMASIGK